ncbi:MAG TPA: tRNA lysidine(34) synthetase TilS [Caulobacteraceae bacterium]|jgi:tRNA(Ile)-lysidine synthase
MSGGPVEARAFAALDRRLDAAGPAPLAVAVSGGGDSMALLLLADAWARRAGRPLRVLSVDHGLNPESGRWAAFVADGAARLGRPAEVLRWRGEKPSTGLPAAARSARHALLADAAREAGARVLLMGHTADDVAEGEQMRAEGFTLGRVREWSPSPAWPEGRGVFLLRPLLGTGRAELREWLQARGEGWIEDPANADPRFGRTRARRHLAAHPNESRSPDAPDPAGESPGAGFRGDERWGGVGLARHASERVLGAALLCASGGVRPPRAEAVQRLAERLRSGGAFTATLAGARLIAIGTQVLVGRESGRSGLAELAVEPGRSVVWDGRFEVASQQSAVVKPLRGSAARLSRADREALRTVPAPFRPTLPVIETGAGAVACPLFTMPPAARSRVGERLRAACGAFSREQDIPR